MSGYMLDENGNVVKVKTYNFYELAAEIGITPETLAVWMQTELTPERRERVEKAIENLSRNKWLKLIKWGKGKL